MYKYKRTPWVQTLWWFEICGCQVVGWETFLLPISMNCVEELRNKRPVPTSCIPDINSAPLYKALQIICEATWSTWCKCCLIHETVIFMVNFVISWLICAVSISVSCWYVGLYQLQYMFEVNSEWWSRSKCCSKWSNLNPDIRTCLPQKSALKLLMR